MNRAIGLVSAAGVLLVGVAGCGHLGQSVNTTATALAEAAAPALTFTALAQDGHVYYSASVDATSLSLQNVLNALGLPVSVSQDPNGTVRIASATPDGSHFDLVIQATGSPGSASTRTKVVMEWEQGADRQKGITALVELEGKSKTKPQTAAKPATRS